MPAVNEINMSNLTFAIWLKRPKSTEHRVVISQQGMFALSCNDKEFKVTLGTGIEGPSHPMPDDDNWHHFALTISGNSADLYLNARKVSWKAHLPALAAHAEGGILIGQENHEPDFLHRITLVHRALPADEILQLYRRGREKSVQDFNVAPGSIFDYDIDTLKKSTMPIQVSATAPMLRDTPPVILPSVYPFEINLTNQNGNVAPAIYIVSDLARTTDVQQIDLEIKNTGADAYQVGAFTLSFRKGTLHENLAEGDAKPFCDKLKAAVETAFGSSTGPKVTTEKQGNTISFKVEATSAKFSFPANRSVTIALSGIYAAPGTGTRTSGYEVKFEEVRKMVDGHPTDPSFFFSRNAVLQVINHQGVSYAPVHFGALGNNFLLNGHGGQNIAIFMQSLDGKELKVGEGTKFIFGFYASEKSEDPTSSLAFGNRSQVHEISTGTLPQGFKPAPKSEVDEHGRRDIIIVSEEKKFASFLAFNFNNIALSGNPGLVKVHVEVENLPGYWDSTFEVTFIKGPMVMAEGQVGIGTMPFKDTALSVQGGTRLEGKVGIGTEPIGENVLTVNGRAHLEGDVDVMGSIGSGDASKSLNVSSNTKFNKNIEVVGTTHLKGDSTTIDKVLTVKGTTCLEGALTLAPFSNISPFPTAMCVAYAEFDIIAEGKNKIFKIRNGGFNIDSMKVEIMSTDEYTSRFCALNTYLKSEGSGEYNKYFFMFNGPRYIFNLDTRFKSINGKYCLSQRTKELELLEETANVKEGSIWIFLYK